MILKQVLKANLRTYTHNSFLLRPSLVYNGLRSVTTCGLAICFSQHVVTHDSTNKAKLLPLTELRSWSLYHSYFH